MAKLLWFLLFAVHLQFVSSAKCHSCLTQCKIQNGRVDSVKCDCLSEEKDQCEADSCFVKIELFSEENTAIVQKGCISKEVSGQSGCQYASNSETINCYCRSNNCNTRHQLNNFMPSRLPSVECCLCSQKNGEECTKSCENKCRGNYCVVDFDGIEQGCGIGYPRLPTFLRTEQYLQYQGDYICARYESVPSHMMNGCVCTHPSGSCNNFTRSNAYQEKNVIRRRADSNNYCYGLSHRSNKPVGEDIFKRSTTCEGHYCFISMTTSELILESADYKHNLEDHQEFVGVARPRYEIQAGCIKKIETGCTIETTGAEGELLAKHCVCEGHLCNFYHLISEAEDPRPKSPHAKHNRTHHHHNKTHHQHNKNNQQAETVKAIRLNAPVDNNEIFPNRMAVSRQPTATSAADTIGKLIVLFTCIFAV